MLRICRACGICVATNVAYIKEEKKRNIIKIYNWN